jgi:hypothetical protein
MAQNPENRSRATFVFKPLLVCSDTVDARSPMLNCGGQRSAA